MTTQTNTTTRTARPIDKARSDFIGAIGSSYGKLKLYAEALTEQFGDGWHLIPLKGEVVGDNAKKLREAVKTEKQLVQNAAEKKELVNIYKPWSDVMAYVKRADEAAKKAAASGADGAGEGDGADGAAPGKATRKLDVRLLEELTKLYCAVMKASDEAETPLSEAIVNANANIGKAIKLLGGDLAKLNSKTKD